MMPLDDLAAVVFFSTCFAIIATIVGFCLFDLAWGVWNVQVYFYRWMTGP